MPTPLAVGPGTRCVGFPASPFPKLAYEHLPLEEALARAWHTDAHCVMYIVPFTYGAQPRVNKHCGVECALHVLLVDVDNPGHAAWTDETMAAAIEFDRATLTTQGVYYTAHGRRIVQPLSAALSSDVAERYIRAHLIALESIGYSVDWACKDWGRHFRMPHVVRDGKTYRSPFVWIDRMTPIALPELPPELPDAPTPRTKPRRVRPDVVASQLPPSYAPLVRGVSSAIVRTVTSDFHAMYLAVAGALLRRVPAEHVPEIVASIAYAAGSSKPEHHRKSALDTVHRYCDGLPTTSFPLLRSDFPGVADALEDALDSAPVSKLRAEAERPVDVTPLEQSTRALEDAIRKAPDGLTLIAAACGLGKSYAAVRIAIERAQKQHKTVSESRRAPPQAKTSIAVDKTNLAMQFVAGVQQSGVSVRRIYGPLSKMRPDGEPECRYHALGLKLVAGGQSVQRTLCLKCEHADVCTAKDGADGPADARVTVGPHALLSALDAVAGTTGLLVDDEPPPTLEAAVVSVDDVATALRLLPAFDRKYTAALTPALLRLEAWDGKQAFADVFEDIELPSGMPPVPPLRREQICAIKASPSYADEVTTASRVYMTIARALTEPCAVRYGARGEALFTLANTRLLSALRREGPVVVLDANAAMNRAIYAKIVGYDPPLHEFDAPDGAPIERTLHRLSSATRKHWFVGHQPSTDGTSLIGALRTALTWADPSALSDVALITFKPLADILSAIVHPHHPHPRLPEPATSDLRAAFPELRGSGLKIAHYGAVRGLNHMASCDALITLGDPWANIGEVRWQCEFLGEEPDARLVAMCKAELEQAHGRLRTIHRTRPGRQLHVGNVLPGGSGWANGGVRIVRNAPGRPAQAPAMTADDFRAAVDMLGGIRGASRLLGVGKSAVQRYCSGERAVVNSLVAVVKAQLCVVASQPAGSFSVVNSQPAVVK